MNHSFAEYYFMATQRQLCIHESDINTWNSPKSNTFNDYKLPTDRVIQEFCHSYIKHAYNHTVDAYWEAHAVKLYYSLPIFCHLNLFLPISWHIMFSKVRLPAGEHACIPSVTSVWETVGIYIV